MNTGISLYKLKGVLNSRNIVQVILLLLVIKNASAQTDTLFWFAVPEVSQNGGQNFDRPIKLRITSYDDTTIVTVSQPAGNYFQPITDTLPPDSLFSVDLTNWIDFLENKPADTIQNFGIKIVSDHRISVYYEVVSQCDCNPEIFALKGQSALGNDFWIPSQNLVSNNTAFTPDPNSSFDIIATENNTLVTILPSKNIIGHQAGVPYSITLNQGQTYSAMAASNLASEHLNGSRVWSDQPIAITVKDDVLRSTIFGTCSDLGGDQIVPKQVLGTEYIAINGFLSTIGDQLFVMAVEDSTDIFKNGSYVAMIDSGVTIQIDVDGGIGDTSTYVNSNKPISVLQLSGYGCEMGIDILPQINCTGSNEVALARSTNESFFVNIVVPAGGENYFLVNGDPSIITSSLFSFVPGSNSQWMAGKYAIPLSVLPVGSSVRITNSTMPFHLSVIHGGAGTGTRFGYFSDFACPTGVGVSYPDKKVFDFNAYPNPVSDKLNINIHGVAQADIFVYDLTGQLISNNQMVNSTISIDTRLWNAGLYLVIVKSGNEVRLKKIVHQ